MDQVRIGVIGCGGMGQGHMQTIAAIPTLKFTAASDNFEANLGKVVQTYGVKGFAKGEELLDSGLVDAVLIATPHYFHVPLSIAAFERDVHVLCEKPISVTAKAAQQAIDAHQKKPRLVFAAMHQMRTDPRWQLVKRIITAGELGAITRVNWIATDWFRSQAYYDSGSWRATWEGEGGGVLLNQCPHNLDLLWWLCGSPSKITAHIGLGKHHRIEVEDDVTAFLEYPNGATGVMTTSTGDAPGTNRLEITGDRGKIVAPASGPIEFHQTAGSVKDFCAHTALKFGIPPVVKASYETANPPQHKAIHENFAAAILRGAPLVAPAAEGIHAVELANAMILSGIQGRPSPYPTDRDAYEKLLADLIAQSRADKSKRTA